jgi:uncharacterized protein
MKNRFASYSPFAQIILLLIIVLASVLVVSVLAIVAIVPFGGLESMMQALSMGELSGGQLGMLKYMQIVQSIGVFVIPAFILAYLVSMQPLQFLQLDKLPQLRAVVMAFLMLLVALPFINIVGQWNSDMAFPSWLSGLETWMRAKEDQAEVITKLFLDSKSSADLWVNVLMIGIIPGIGEELLFRGVIQKLLKRITRNDHWAVWLTALLFSAIHLQFYGFIPRALLGAFFGYVLVYSRNLWLPVLVHFLNNTLAVFAYHYYNKGVIDVDPDAIGTGSGSIVWALVSLVLFAVLFYKFKQHYDCENTDGSETKMPSSETF